MKPLNGLKKDLHSYFTNTEMNRVYNLINRKDWSPFMNHGYKNLDNSDVIKYNNEDIKWSNRINLYTHLIEILKKYISNFEDLKLLDVGCGFGYGSFLLKKYYKFKNVTALDFNGNFIKDAKSKFNNVNYIHGSATSLPFKDNSFDLLTNIESLHHYKNNHFYYREAYRVLKKGGYLLMTDPFDPYENDLIAEDFFARSGFYMTDKINITPMVIKSCEDDLINFKLKHKELNNQQLNYFEDIAKQKHKLYNSNGNIFLSYIFYKI